MIKDHFDNEAGNLLLPLPGLVLPINSKGFMHHPTDTIVHTTVFVTPVVEYWMERETVQWVHYRGSTAPWTDALPQRYVLFLQWKNALLKDHLTSCLSRTSVFTGMAIPPSVFTSCSRSFIRSTLRAAMATLAPFLVRARTIAEPIPLDAPVTMATFPWRGELPETEKCLSVTVNFIL